MEFNDPSILSATMGNTKNGSSYFTQNGKRKNKVENTIANNFGAMNPINAFLDKLTASQDKNKVEGSIMDYKPSSSSVSYNNNDTTLMSTTSTDGTDITGISNTKVVYSINELLSFRKTIPQELIDLKQSQLPNKKFWRLHQRFNPNSDNTGGYHNKTNNRNANNGDLGRNERRNSRTKNNAHSNAKTTLNKKQQSHYKHKNNDLDDSLLMNEEIMKFDDNFVPSGNTMQDFELWKAKMKELEQNKGKHGKIGPNSTHGRPTNPSANDETDDIPSTETAVTATTSTEEEDSNRPGLNKSSSMMSDFLNLSNKNDDNNKTSITNSESPNDNTHEQQSGVTPRMQGPGGIELSRSSSSKFSSFFNTNTNNNETNDTNAEKRDKTDVNASPINRAETTGTSVNGGSRLMNFFKDSSRSNTPVNENAALHNANPIVNKQMPQNIQGNFQRSVHAPVTMQQQQQQPMDQVRPMIVPSPQQQQSQQQQQPQPMPMPMPMPMMQGPGTNAFFQDLLNKNKMMENNPNVKDGKAKPQDNKSNNINPNNIDKMTVPPPPPGMLPPPPGMPQQNFRMMPPNMMGHPMMHIPPPPGMMQFPPEGMKMNNKDTMDKDKNSEQQIAGNKNSNNNTQQRFYPMMPPPPGFPSNMQQQQHPQFPPNMQQFPPNMQKLPPQMQINKNGEDNHNNVNNNNMNPNQMMNANTNNLQRFFPNMPMNPQQMQSFPQK